MGWGSMPSRSGCASGSDAGVRSPPSKKRRAAVQARDAAFTGEKVGDWGKGSYNSNCAPGEIALLDADSDRICHEERARAAPLATEAERGPALPNVARTPWPPLPGGVRQSA